MIWTEKIQVWVSMWLLLGLEDVRFPGDQGTRPLRKIPGDGPNLWSCGCAPEWLFWASLQSMVAMRRRNSSVCFHCTSRRHSSSFYRRRCCHHWSGTGRRLCFLEGRSWRETHLHLVGFLLPPGPPAVCGWEEGSRGQVKREGHRDMEDRRMRKGGKKEPG